MQALPAVKIQAMRIALRTTHQSSSPQWGEVYVRLRRVVLVRVRSLVDYSLQSSSTKRKGKKREKSPSTYTEHLKTENVRHNLVNFLRVTRNPVAAMFLRTFESSRRLSVIAVSFHAPRVADNLP